VAPLFFLSGAAALVYQVAWQRVLGLHTGIGLYSVTIIVSAFMAGLGIGGLVGGRWSERMASRTALRRFAQAELGIATFGALSPWLYYDRLYPLAVQLPSPSLAGALLHFAALLPPTLLMGMSLPFLVRATVTRAGDAGRTIGWLYGVNLLGAAVGAFVTPWVLIARYGIRGALLVAAGANLTVALGAFALSLMRGADVAGAREEERVPAASPDAPGGRPFALWIALYGLSGFLALSLEIVWFRLTDVAVKSTAFTFGTVLAIYLAGCACGCVAGIPIVDRIRRPLRAFLVCQCAIVCVAALGVALIAWLPHGMGWARWYHTYWASAVPFALGHSMAWTPILRLYLILPSALFFIPTTLMGLSFPILQRAVHDEVRRSGRRVGVLQAANIAGCTIGSLVVGLGAVRWFGTVETLRLLVLCGAAFALVGWRYYGRQFAIALVAVSAAAMLVPGQDRMWRLLHGLTNPAARMLVEEDGTGIVALKEVHRRRVQLVVNGIGISWLPYGEVHTLLGVVPAVMHPSPHDVAVVGLGSGDTAWAVGCRPETRSVTVFEISSPQPRVLARALDGWNFPDLARFLGDPRVSLRMTDGRRALEAESRQYDIIETDAMYHVHAMSGNIYSVEFFRTCSRRLRPGGLMCTYSPTSRVRATFRRVFPHWLVIAQGWLLVGSNDPIALAPEVWASRLDAASPYLGSGSAEMVRSALPRMVLPTGKYSLDMAPNEDLFPRDEFAFRDRARLSE